MLPTIAILNTQAPQPKSHVVIFIRVVSTPLAIIPNAPNFVALSLFVDDKTVLVDICCNVPKIIIFI